MLAPTKKFNKRMHLIFFYEWFEKKSSTRKQIDGSSTTSFNPMVMIKVGIHKAIGKNCSNQ